MKQTVYILRNVSGSPGEYLLNGEYEELDQHKEIILNQKPVSVTANIKVIPVRKEVK
jgi:hypothetical protein